MPRPAAGCCPGAGTKPVGAVPEDGPAPDVGAPPAVPGGSVAVNVDNSSRLARTVIMLLLSGQRNSNTACLSAMGRGQDCQCSTEPRCCVTRVKKTTLLSLVSQQQRNCPDTVGEHESQPWGGCLSCQLRQPQHQAHADENVRSAVGPGAISRIQAQLTGRTSLIIGLGRLPEQLAQRCGQHVVAP
jgi:hypothetical protein